MTARPVFTRRPPDGVSVRRMNQVVQTRPSCRICGQLMTMRDRAPAQHHLAAEFVCWNFECLEFGIYKRAAR